MRVAKRAKKGRSLIPTPNTRALDTAGEEKNQIGKAGHVNTPTLHLDLGPGPGQGPNRLQFRSNHNERRTLRAAFTCHSSLTNGEDSFCSLSYVNSSNATVQTYQ
jgi:hypothetical protein